METEKAELEAQQLKEKFDYDEYMMLKENNQQASILNHDFKEHIGALSSLIGADNEIRSGIYKIYLRQIFSV